MNKMKVGPSLNGILLSLFSSSVSLLLRRRLGRLSCCHSSGIATMHSRTYFWMQSRWVPGPAIRSKGATRGAPGITTRNKKLQVARALRLFPAPFLRIWRMRLKAALPKMIQCPLMHAKRWPRPSRRSKRHQFQRLLGVFVRVCFHFLLCVLWVRTEGVGCTHLD